MCIFDATMQPHAHATGPKWVVVAIDREITTKFTKEHVLKNASLEQHAVRHRRVCRCRAVRGNRKPISAAMGLVVAAGTPRRPDAHAR